MLARDEKQESGRSPRLPSQQAGFPLSIRPGPDQVASFRKKISSTGTSK
jgi:hypothetical protein